MKILKIVFIFILFALAMAIVYRIKFSTSMHDDCTLVVGTSLDYHPYAFKDPNTEQPLGLDIDVMTELAARLQKNLIIKDMPFASLIFSLLTHDIDVIAAGMSPTERRARMVKFSEPYVQGQSLVILTKKSHFEPKNIQDLYGKTVAVNTGYIADLEMSKHPEINLVKLDTPADCFMALQVGSVDAFVASYTNVATFLERHAQKNQFAVHEIENTQEVCVLAVSKNDTKLLEQINQALQAMHDDGTLLTLQRKWIV